MTLASPTRNHMVQWKRRDRARTKSRSGSGQPAQCHWQCKLRPARNARFAQNLSSPRHCKDSPVALARAVTVTVTVPAAWATRFTGSNGRVALTTVTIASSGQGCPASLRAGLLLRAGTMPW